MEERMRAAAGAEELLVMCANAIQNRNGVVARQAVHTLQKMSSLDGELPSERVTAYFLRALILRAGSLLHDPPNKLIKSRIDDDDDDDDDEDHLPRLDPPHQMLWAERALGCNELTNLVDMTPYYRFGFMAANGAILEAFEGMDRVHILDFSTSHCMQWPTLIDALADRMDGPPHVRLTVSTAVPPTPPRLHPPYEEVGHRLALWAQEKGVPFEFHILSRPLETLRISDIDIRDGESLAVNCNLRLHYLADETLTDVDVDVEALCPRDKFLSLVAALNPAVVTIYEQDCNVLSPNLATRLTESYNHEWIPFDYLATYGSRGRHEHERDVGQRIENVLACEGVDRIERLESKSQWLQRLRRLHFRPVTISDDVIAALREMVGDYAVGWGMKLDEEDVQILSWKGHSFAFASAWTPAATTATTSSSSHKLD